MTLDGKDGTMSVRRLLVTAALLIATAGAKAAPAAAVGTDPTTIPWAGAWATAMVAANTEDIFGIPDWSQEGFANHSVRQVLRVSRGGSAVRIRLSNHYGTTPLRLSGASIGQAGTGASVQPGSLRPLRFGGSAATVVPVGEEAVSDPAPMVVAPLERLTVTLYFARPTGPATYHTFATATAYRATGDHRFDPSAAAFGETSLAWYYLTGVDVAGGPAGRRDAVVAFGDSITDGPSSTLDADNRYPDELAERLVAAGRPLGVLNTGIASNRVLSDSPCFGERATARFQRDVLDRPQVHSVIVLEGINDIGASEANFGACFLPNPQITADELIDGYRALIRAAHAHGIRAIGATLTPIKGSFFDTERAEAVRDAVNHWIRTGGEYDAVVDFDRALADPADPDRLRAAYDSGDGLHPNDAGMHAMAAAIDLHTL
jgi:lysophospholipase L1-like esterase